MNVYLMRMYATPNVDDLSTITRARYAHFSAVGTWWPIPANVCAACNSHDQRLVEPLLLQWEPSAHVIGDFSWDGPFGFLCVAQPHVVSFFRDEQFEFAANTVEFVTPRRSPSRNTPIPYPYCGPKLSWIESTSFVHLDRLASNVGVEMSCSMCGTVRYRFATEGLVIRRGAWDGQRMFRITSNGRSHATFVTDEGRCMIEGAGFSNVEFSFAGRIIDE